MAIATGGGRRSGAGGVADQTDSHFLVFRETGERKSPPARDRCDCCRSIEAKRGIRFSTDLSVVNSRSIGEAPFSTQRQSQLSISLELR